MDHVGRGHLTTELLVMWHWGTERLTVARGHLLLIGLLLVMVQVLWIAGLALHE